MDAIKYVAFVWYAADDYDAARACMLDAEKLPKTYGEWLRKTTQAVKDWEQRGYVAIKAHIHSQFFPDWCIVHNVKPDADGRLHYGNLTARDAALKARQ